MRAVVEKPFGHDLESGRHLNEVLLRVFQEKQIYRIDHYLGKETVQNIFVLRFANGIFEPLWNHRYIDHVQISVAESVGVGHRAGFYESAGVLRDMFQNHLHAAPDADGHGAARGLRGRRDPRREGQGARVDPAVSRRGDRRLGRARPVRSGRRRRQARPGYREEEGVDPQSHDADLRGGEDRDRQLALGGRAVLPAFGQAARRSASPRSRSSSRASRTASFSRASGELLPNVLRLHIQPDEGVSLKFGVKIPGSVLQIQSVYMDFPYSKLGAPIAGGYERLLLDVTHGDQTLFIRGDEAEHAWEVLTPILKAWERVPPPDFPNYAAGTFGPEAADRFLEKDGRRWRTL